MQESKTRRITVTFRQTIGTIIPEKPYQAPYTYIIRNVPHNGIYFPAGMEEWYADHGINLLECARWLTDHYTSDLFGEKLPGTTQVNFLFNRIVCDAERLIDDPLEKRGLGIQYDLSLITGLKNAPLPTRESMMRSYYLHYNWLKSDIEKGGELPLVLDCHSFSEHDNVLCPNAHEFKDIDICLGYNEDQTKPAESTLRFVANHFRNHGYRVAFNKPFSNSKTVETDHPYHSLMIEVNKHCYMNEDTLERTSDFDKLHNVLIALQKSLLRS